MLGCFGMCIMTMFVSVCGKDEIRDVKDNINNFKMILEVCNDAVDVVSMWGKNEFRVDDFENDVYVVINDSVVKDVNSKDDHNDNLSVENQVQLGLMCEQTLRVNRHSNGQELPLCNHYVL